MTRMDPTRRRRRPSVLALLPCVSLIISSPNCHQVNAFSTTPSTKPSFPFSIQSSIPLIFSSPLTSAPTNHKSHLKASTRMRTLMILTSTDKDTESSSVEYNGGQAPTTIVNEEKPQTVVTGEQSNDNGNQRLSVLDKVSGMFKISTPNVSIPKPFFPFSPQPPDEAPYVDAQLQVDLMESERSIQMLGAEVNMLREQLGYQQDDYLKLQNEMRSIANQERKLKEETRLVQQLEQAQQQQQLEKQYQHLKTTQQQLELAQRNITSLETEYQHRLAVQSKDFAHQQEQLERQIADLSHQLTTIKSALEIANQRWNDQTLELKQFQQAAESQKETMEQQIAKLETSLKEANSTNVQLQGSLSTSKADLEALRKDWQDLQTTSDEKEAAQIAMLESQHNETKLALQVAEELLKKTIVEQGEVAEETKKAWSLERQELESQVESLQLQLASEKTTTEKALAQYKLAQTELELAQKDKLQQLEESQATADRLKTELEQMKAQYEAELESMAIKKDEHVHALTERIQTEHNRQEQELQDESAKVKAELAKMKLMYEQSEEARQAETKALEIQLTGQLETAQAKAARREQALLSQIEMAAVERVTKTKSLEKEIAKLQHENKALSSSLVFANTSRDESIEKAKALEQKYMDSGADQEKWKEQVSLMKQEFQDIQQSKKELEAQLVTVTLEKEELVLKAQALEANLQALTEQNAQLKLQQQHRPYQQRQKDSNDFHWALDKF